VNNSNIGKKLLNDLQKIQKEEISKLKMLEDDLKKKDTEINKVKNIISKEELENKIKLLKKEINEYNIKKDEIEIKFNNNKNKRQEDLIKQINPLIIKYMSDNSIDLIISKQIVYLGKSERDITNDILQLINESFK
jgi:Skp family chaperone for outer membrane proteins